MNTTLKAELKKISKAIEESDDNILIRNYIKTTNRYRTQRERAHVLISIPQKTYPELLKESRNELMKISRDQFKQVAKKYDVNVSDVDDIVGDLVDSLSSRIQSNNDSEWKPDDKYEYFGNGIKVKKEDSTIYISGKMIDQKIISAGKYKEKNSRTKTLIKDEFRRNLPHKTKMFKIESKDFYKISLTNKQKI